MRHLCGAETKTKGKCRRAIKAPSWQCGIKGHPPRRPSTNFAAPPPAAVFMDNCARWESAIDSLEAQSLTNKRITHHTLGLITELVDAVRHSDPAALQTSMLTEWYDPPDESLSHEQRRQRRHAALLLAETIIDMGVAPAGATADDLVGPPIQRPEGFVVQEQKPKRPKSTVEDAQVLWDAAATSAGTLAALWLAETRRAWPTGGHPPPWSLRTLAPSDLVAMPERFPQLQAFPDDSELIAVWAFQNHEGEICCVDLDALKTHKDRAVATEKRWRRNVGKRQAAAIFVDPDGRQLPDPSAEIVYMVEGPVDAAAVAQHYQAPAVACGGTGHPTVTAEIIRQVCPDASIVAIADGDRVGRKAMQKAADTHRCIVEVIEMPDGTDPGDYYART